MTAIQILALQIVTNLVVYGLAARWYILPRLAQLPLAEALTPLLLFHALRTLGLTFLIPQTIGVQLPDTFAGPAAYGDLLAAGLALLALAFAGCAGLRLS